MEDHREILSSHRYDQFEKVLITIYLRPVRIVYFSWIPLETSLMLIKAVSDLLGYSRDELCGLKITDLLTNVDLNDDPLHLSSLQINHVIVKEEKLRRKDGKVIQVEIHNQKLHEDIVLSIVRDMTSQKEEQVIFHQMEDRYRLIVETATEGICTMDECNLITYVNIAAGRHGGIF